MRTLLRFPAFTLALLFPIGSTADEFTTDLVDDIVSGCLEWLDTRERTTFDNEWLLSEESARDLQLAEKFPELEPTSLHFYSHSLSYIAILRSHISTCSVVDNFLEVDETGAVVSPDIESDFRSILTAVRDWGYNKASGIGFIDWPEEAERKLLNQREDFVFFKRRCSEGDLITIQAVAAPERTLIDGIPLPAWQITISRYGMSDEGFDEYVLRACPKTS